MDTILEEPPMSYDEAKLERLVLEAPPGLDEPTKKKTRQMSREYQDTDRMLLVF